MDDQRPAAPAYGGPPPDLGTPPPPPQHRAARRPLPRRFAPLAAVLVVVLVGGAVAAALVLGGGEGDSDGGMALLAAADPGRDDFTGDLDLLAADQRALPAGERPRLPFVDLDEPVALAGLGIRGAEAGLYTAHRDEPTCDVDQLTERLLGESGDDPDPAAAAWFGAIARNIEDDGRDDYLDQLTAVRLRVDTRVVAHGFPEGSSAVPYPAVLQAGTAVLVDETGVPRVRCTGGTPLGEADPAAEDAEADVPDGAWSGFDPAGVVVVESRIVEDGFELASAGGPDDEGNETFLRAIGSNGDRDRGVFVPGGDDREPAEGCAEGCHELEIAVTSGGATLTFEGVARPDETDDQRLFWREAEPTTYKFSVAQPWKDFAQFGLDEQVPPPPYDDPAVEGEEIIFEPADPTEPVPVNRLVECIPGPVTITITVDGTVAQTLDRDVDCTGATDLEFVLE